MFPLTVLHWQYGAKTGENAHGDPSNIGESCLFQWKSAIGSGTGNTYETSTSISSTVT